MRFNLLVLLLLPLSVWARPGYFEPWGKDADLRVATAQEAEAPKLSLPARLMEKAIWLRQHVLSPTDGPRSHFRPTSSEYMRRAIHKYGFLQGYLMGCDRLMRENSDEWVYRKVEEDGKWVKYDPVR
jgi:hypothetical protein